MTNIADRYPRRVESTVGVTLESAVLVGFIGVSDLDLGEIARSTSMATSSDCGSRTKDRLRSLRPSPVPGFGSLSWENAAPVPHTVHG